MKKLNLLLLSKELVFSRYSHGTMYQCEFLVYTSVIARIKKSATYLNKTLIITSMEVPKELFAVSTRGTNVTNSFT